MQREILTISQLNNRSKQLLEKNFAIIWVEGEVSNFSRPNSGHWYFTLKDNKAQIRCAMFRQANQSLNFTPENGMMLTLKVRVTLYEPRGDYQLICQYAEPAGDGKLLREFEQLKQRLEMEGLFRPELKKPLPSFPNKVGIISSASGAALQDILNVLKRRAPTLEIVVYSSSVQGEGAIIQLLQAIDYFIHTAQNKNKNLSPFDVLIIARGGGSLEDLQAFNNETLARRIVKCPIPIVSAIGHEIDFSISDFVADVRAATPSVAAELISPNQPQWVDWLNTIESKLNSLIQQNIRQRYQQVQQLSKQLVHPKNKLETLQQQLDNYSQDLHQQMAYFLKQKQQQLQMTELRIKQVSPQEKLNQNKVKIQYLKQQLQLLISGKIDKKQNDLKQTVNSLNLLSPLTIMTRGYALVSDKSNKHDLIKTKQQVKSGDEIGIQFIDGKVNARIL